MAKKKETANRNSLNREFCSLGGFARKEPLNFDELSGELQGSDVPSFIDGKKIFKASGCFKKAMLDMHQNKPIDTTDAEYIFASSFLMGDVCTRDEFDPILIDFNVKKSGRFEEFFSYVPMLEMADITRMTPDDFVKQEIVGLLYGGVKAGDGYCREVLRMLFKTFYKDEYNQLKRFSTITLEDVASQSKCDNAHFTNVAKACRLLCMAHVLGIQVCEDCRIFYIAASDIVADKNEKAKKAKDAAADRALVDGDHLRENLQNDPRVDRILNSASKDRDGDYVRYELAHSIINRLFADQFGFAKNYVDNIIPVLPPRSVEYINAIISDLGISNKLSDNDIILLAPFVSVMSGFTDLVMNYKNLLYSFLYPNTNMADNQSQILTALGNLKFTDNAKNKSIAAKSAPRDERISEECPKPNETEDDVTELKQRLREMEGKYAELRSLYEHEKAEKSDLQDELAKLETVKVELQKLRDYVYNETEEDVRKNEISYEEMKAAIKDRNVMIIGGNENWTKKLKNEFPNWKFVKAVVSSTVTSSIIMNCEKVYFFTGTLGHSNYAKFVDLARYHGVDFSYMHGVNVQKNVRQVYHDLIG